MSWPTRLVETLKRRSRLRDWSHLFKIAAAPGAILVLFAITVAISLGALIYAQHASNSIVQRDMRLVTTLSSVGARFDHEDGDLYRLMVDKAAGGRRTIDIAGRSATIKENLARIHRDLVAIRPALRPEDQGRTQAVLAQIERYSETIDVVSSMLDVNFAASAAMLAPFRSNADQVHADLNAMGAAGTADARRHAALAAERTRWLVAIVSGAMLLLALLSIAWLALASHRGLQLRNEIGLRKSAEASALVLARHDPLTDLVNRRVFVEAITALIGGGEAAAEPFAVVLVDLDDFKAVNDLYGHAAGDAVLRVVSERLRALSGPDATLARLGGDEFAALLPGRDCGDALSDLIDGMCDRLQQPFVWDGRSLHVGASIGISLFPRDAVAIDTLFHAADVAMYQAKRAQKGTFRFFERALETERMEQRRHEDELRIAIGEGGIQPYYQPIVRLVDGSICGFEILARWHHSRLGLMTPDAFIRTAEETRQINALTEALLRRACVEMRLLPPHLTISLNISPVQLADPDLPERLLGIIVDAGVRPDRFEIELTENAVMDDAGGVEHAIDIFRRAGVSIALDDFGTGFSSLSILRRLRFDKIKIDRSFVQTMSTSAESEKIVDAILNLASSFGVEVTAEGIETEAVATWLLRKGCTNGQGYHFGRPLPFACGGAEGDGAAAATRSLPSPPPAIAA